MEHKLRLTLASGADLELLWFSQQDQTWIFSHTYRQAGDTPRSVRLLNNSRLTVRYERGRPVEVTLCMHIIIPERLGQKFLAGLDISPGAKTHFTFEYAKEGDDFHLREIIKGCATRLSLNEGPSEQLMRRVEFPFPVPIVIKKEFGSYACPFLDQDDQIGEYTFPSCTLRGGAAGETVHDIKQQIL